MRYIDEAGALAAIEAKLSGLDGYDLAIFSREPTGVATYTAQIAIKLKTKDATEALIAKLIELAAREDKPITFAGSKVDTERDIETTYIFLDAAIEAKV